VKQYFSKNFLQKNHSKTAVINGIIILHKSFDINKFKFLSMTGGNDSQPGACYGHAAWLRRFGS